jgi:DNA-binding LacI/PurR family transcriptional regulator
VLSKSDRLVQLLEQKLSEGEFSAGQRFLSTHEIARSYSVSPGTARRALGELVGRGYLKSSHRSGHFLREDAPLAGREAQGRPERAVETAAATTLMLIVGSVGKWGERLLDQYAKGLREACGAIGWRLVQVSSDPEEIERARQGAEVVGCVAYGLHEPPAGDVDQGAIICWGGSWRNFTGCHLEVDGESLLRKALEHLWDLGHQRVALLRAPSPEAPAGHKQGMILGMRKAYASMGLTWRPEDVIQVDQNTVQGLYDRVVQAGITGVCCADWEIAIELYRQAHARGEKIGRRLSIVASGGNDLAELVHPRPARMYWRFEDFGDMVVELLENLRRGKRLPHRVNLPLFLEVGPGASPRLE